MRARLTALGSLLVVLAIVAHAKQPLGKLEQLLTHLVAGTSAFAVPIALLAGTPPEISVAAGDFNGDGLPDVAVASKRAGALILPGNGESGFGVPVREAVHARQTSTSYGDFNGDGVADRALADRFASWIALQLGDGAGRYRPASGKLAALVMADFDRDGAVDLAFIDGEAREVVLLLHQRSGARKSENRIPLPGVPRAIALGDFNGDGVADLAVAGRNPDGVSILVGDGHGRFSARTPVSLERSPEAMAVADFDDDGVADLVVADTHGLTVVLGSRRSAYRASGQFFF